MTGIVLREWTLDPYDGDQAPPHIHHRDDEAFYVLDGRLEVRDGERRIRLGPGEFHVVAAGSVHTFATAGPDPARVLVVMSPEIDSLITALHSDASPETWARHHASPVDEP
jgi:mannose-6-phosphate isomerase-like protein (cupin superfamily)